MMSTYELTISRAQQQAQAARPHTDVTHYTVYRRNSAVRYYYK